MKTLHTPGPWILNGALGRIEDCKGRLLATPVFESQDNHSTTYGSDENLSNAKLIASSPELLEALKFANNIIDRLCEDYSSVANKHANFTVKESNVIESAIKKAEG